jgi:glycosyltransferase 2 family protein
MRYLCIGLVAAVALACLYGLRSDLAVISLAPVLRSWDLVLLAVLCSLVNYALRIWRWQRYLARLGFAPPLRFTALAYLGGFAFTISPGKVGEMARAGYYARLGIPVAEVAGAFCVERLLDLLAMLLLAMLTLAAMPRYHLLLWTAGALMLSALVLLMVLPWGSLLGSGPPARLPRLLSRLFTASIRALTAARSLLRPGPLLLGLSTGLLAWGLEGLGLGLLSSMFPPAHLAPPLAVGIYAVAVLVGALSFLPGGLGSTEAVMTALLVAQGYSVANALLVTVVCRMVTLWLAVALGWSALGVLRNRWMPASVPWP